jgi:hypothetical protein
MSLADIVSAVVTRALVTNIKNVTKLEKGSAAA